MLISTESLFARHKIRKDEKSLINLTRNAMPVFLRAKDAISIGPQITGYHEKRIYDLVSKYAELGYSDFFIDIGANIGLSTCQSGHLFKEINCYEPNPDCYKILSVNTKICLGNQVNLNNFGLGANDSEINLLVPKNNWGGGFIKDEFNSYSEEQLLSKDGTKSFDTSNYDQITIQIRSAEKVFTELFKQLKEKNLNRGFIKIDVEGYEPLIIRALTKVLPKDMSVVILFECFDKQANPNELISENINQYNIFKLVRFPEKKENRLLRAIKILLKNGYEYKLVPYHPSHNSSDLIIEIDNSQ